jgi:molybdopterin-biosynthesis enzyme MoeA-like protein
LIVNKVSGAPGIRHGNIFILAGVPHIAAGMLDALTGTLEGGLPVVSVTVGGMVPESEVADLLRETERAHEGIAIGSYPFFREGRVGANFVVRSESQDDAQAVADLLQASLESAGYQVVMGGI